MRNIAASDKFSIYFGTAPILIGEACLIYGLYALLAFDFILENIAGCMIFMLVGGFFVYRKAKILRKGVSALKYGVKTEAILTWVINTDIEHNRRIVKEYLFEYHVDGYTHTYEYKSAYKRHLKIGDKMTIFYLSDKPDKSFIPKLYNVYIYS